MSNSPIIKNALTLISGNAVSFLIPILLYPLLGRVFTPEDYALFGLYFGIFTFVEIASAARYDLAIILPEHKEDAINLMAGGFLISLLYFLFISALVLFLRHPLAAWLKNPYLGSWLLLLPFAILLVSISKLCNNWLIREKKFRASSINKASQKIAESGTQLIFGTIKFGNGLIIGDLIGRLFNSIFSLYQIKNSFNRKLIAKSSIYFNLKKYLDFPKYGVIPSMLNTLGGMLPMFVVSSYFSVEESGNFNFSRIVLSVPFALIASGISQVLMQMVSERRNKSQSISNELISIFIKLLVLSIVGMIPVYFFGAEIFEFIFGHKWRLSGEFTSTLVISYAISFIVSPFSVLLVSLKQIRLMSLWQFAYFALINILWLTKRLSITEFLVALVIIDVISYTIYGILILRAVKNYENNIIGKSHEIHQG